MKPDKETLQHWMSGELSREKLESVETWVSHHPEELEKMMDWGGTSALIQSTVSSSEEPPYAEFFNHKVQQQIEAESTPVASGAIEQTSIWARLRHLWAPLGAAAMIACFYAGTQMSPSRGDSIPGAVASSEASVGEIYVPQGGVTASVYENEQSGIIMLNGLKAIPDTLDIVAASPSGKSYPDGSAKVMVRHTPSNYF